MDIYPAIDLYGGKVVRLTQGDYDQMTVYRDDPLAAALEFQAAGAETVHMVDLAGARDGGTPHFDLVALVARDTRLKVEIGGGIRTEEAVRRYLDAGVERVILGTAAVEDWPFLVAMTEKYGEHLAVSVDCRDGIAAVRGWRKNSGISGLDLCRNLEKAGVAVVIYTDIARDGAMTGSNRAIYRTLVRELSMKIVASGGVSSLEEVATLRDTGVAAAILGRAYYTGEVDLAQALRVART